MIYSGNAPNGRDITNLCRHEHVVMAKGAKIPVLSRKNRFVTGQARMEAFSWWPSGIPTTLALGAEGIDQPEKAHRGDRTRRHTRKSCLPSYQPSKVRSRSTASGKRPAIVYCSHGVSEEHRKHQKGSGELDGSAHAAHNCILRWYKLHK